MNLSLSNVYAHEAFPLGSDPALRNIASLYEPGRKDYWSNYIGKFAERYAKDGLRGVILHNPFGTAPGNRYVIDAWQAAPNWLRYRFVEEWRAFIRLHPTFEVLGYVGPYAFDPATRLTVERVRAAVKPLVDAGMSVGFDASARFLETDLRLQVMRELWNDGVPVYCEAWPTTKWMAEFHVLTTPEVLKLQQANPEKYVARADIAGNVIAWTANVFTSPTAHAAQYKALLDAGVMAAGPIRYFFEANSDPRLIEQ